MGTRCPVQFIEYIDENGNKQLINCYFKRGPNNGMSKGSLRIAKELNVPVPKACKLDQLRSLLSQHRAFQNLSITFHLLKIISFFCVYITKLEELANKYKVKIVFVPKYHCEYNPIEGLWCHKKAFVRKRTDQIFARMITLIGESFVNFTNVNLSLKLFRRFWQTLEAYNKGDTYEQIVA